MLTFFRIIDTHSKLHTSPAELNARELARLRTTLQSAGILADPDDGEVDGIAYNFEANANAIALARFAGIFEHRLDLVAIMEEAQFLGRSISVSRASCDATATIHVSEHIAISPEIALSNEQADDVLQCLNLSRASARPLPLSVLRELLQTPSVYHRFAHHKLSHVFEYLARMADTECGDQLPHLAWT